jgi:hypothetical protein
MDCNFIQKDNKRYILKENPKDRMKDPINDCLEKVKQIKEENEYQINTP